MIFYANLAHHALNINNMLRIHHFGFPIRSPSTDDIHGCMEFPGSNLRPSFTAGVSPAPDLLRLS